MIKKKDFIWTIGFQGNTAIVNRKESAAHRELDPVRLLEEGMLRAAFCSALWQQEIENKADSLEKFREDFKRITGLQLGIEEMKRMLGVYQVPRENLSIQAI
jgi:hypothetical protein